MADRHEIPENVIAFLAKAAAAYGKYAEEMFSIDLWGSCGLLKSPIEQLFLISFCLVSKRNFGYQVLHFTGSEVVKDPCKVALEAFVLATGLKDVATHPFDDE